MTLSSADAASFGLRSVGTEQLTLADGSEVISTICPAAVVWDGQPRQIDVDVLAATPLVGMAMMRGYEMKAAIEIGGIVTLKALEQA